MAEAEFSQASVGDLTKPVQDLLDGIVTQLKGTVAIKGAAQPPLFFPNGIELIQLIVKVGPADVEVTVAGPKGSKESLSKANGKARLMDIHDMNVCAPVNTDDIFRGDYITWHNDGHDDIEIVFDVDGCPLNVCDFTVPKDGGEYLTVVLNTVDPGTYEYHCHKAPRKVHGTAIQGNPKIIIQ